MINATLRFDFDPGAINREGTSNEAQNNAADGTKGCHVGVNDGSICHWSWGTSLL
jgi:hypothetical protein